MKHPMYYAHKFLVLYSVVGMEKLTTGCLLSCNGYTCALTCAWCILYSITMEMADPGYGCQ